MTLQEPPEDVRTREIKPDRKLGPEEKETTLVFPSDEKTGTIYSEVRTAIKWVLSVEASNIESVRLSDNGSITAVKAKIPRSIVTLKSKSRKSNERRHMVRYGGMRE